METWCGFGPKFNKIACPIMLDRHDCFTLVNEFGAKKVAVAAETLSQGSPIIEVRNFIIHGGLCPEG